MDGVLWAGTKGVNGMVWENRAVRRGLLGGVLWAGTKGVNGVGRVNMTARGGG